MIFVRQYNRILTLRRDRFPTPTVLDTYGSVFESTDCTGRAYTNLSDPPNPEDISDAINVIFYGAGKFRIFEASATTTTITMRSFFDSEGCRQPPEPEVATNVY